jgi:hypothetical protein
MEVTTTVLQAYNMSGLIRDPQGPKSSEISDEIRKPYQADPASRRATQVSDGMAAFDSLVLSHAYLTGDDIRNAVRSALAREVDTFGPAPEGSLLADLLSLFGK